MAIPSQPGEPAVAYERAVVGLFWRTVRGWWQGPTARQAALLTAALAAALLGGTGLSRSDAFLNLQADGAERKASAVTRINNSDGSRTYLELERE